MLLVDDDVVSAELTRAMLRESGLLNPISHVDDGNDAVAWLGERLLVEHRPVLVLLDLHLPGRDGLSILRWMRAQEALAGVPVVMLTAVNRLAEIDEAYELGIASYLVKPVGVDAVVGIVRDLALPWALLPGAARRG